jgi:hypothetical protein
MAFAPAGSLPAGQAAVPEGPGGSTGGPAEGGTRLGAADDGSARPPRAGRARTTLGKILTPARTAGRSALVPARKAAAPAIRALAPAAAAWRRVRPAPRPGAPGIRSAEVAGSVLARLTALPALLVLAWLLPGVPLLLAGQFLPVPMLLISVPLAAVLIVNGLRVVPASWPRLVARGRTARADWTSWFGLLATVAVIAGLIAWQLAESSEALIVVRDPGTYLQTGYWIAQHGSLPVPESLKAFGGAHPGLTFTSTGFLARGNSLYPAGLPGLSLLLAGGFWVHGTTGALAVGPLLGGLAALAFAGLVARLVGPQWAPGGALLLGLSLPQQYVGRTSLSETAMQVVIFGGLCLLADSLVLRGISTGTNRARPRRAATSGGWRAGLARATAWRPGGSPARWAVWLTPERVLAGLAGLTLASGLVISLGSLVYLIPVIPFACVLAAGRRPQAAPFLAGIGLGFCYGAVSCYLLARPFLDTVGEITALAGTVAAWLVAASVAGFLAARSPREQRIVPKMLARRPLRWLPEFGALLAAAALIGFAVRPYVQRVHGSPSPAVQAFIVSLQRAQGLPADPTRLYSEQALYWVIWYIGLPTVLLGGFGIVLLTRRCLRALITWQDPDRIWRPWGLPLAIICAGSAVVLWYPDVVPDQPWASRRLVVMVIPGLIICGLWAAALLGRRARDRGASTLTAGAAGLFCTAAMLVPTVATTFGLGLSHSGKSGGLKPVVQGLALRRTGVGQVEAVTGMCAQIPADSSVVIISLPTAQEFSQVVRGMCRVPVASMAGEPGSSVEAVIASINAAGRRPLLLASSARRLVAFGGTPERILDLYTGGDPHDLTQLPTAPAPVHYQVWLTAPPANSGLGA